MVESASNLSAALDDWRALLGAENVIVGEPCQLRYGQSTSGVRRRIPAALIVSGDEPIPEILQVARQRGVALYPISTGHNWGYGTANPAADDCVVLDMSGMKQISQFDPDMGVVTVEPGVTQGQLREFLDGQDVEYMVPVTGAGPSVSILGNALERGYGITPYMDHFMSVTAVEAILPNGDRYRSALRELGAVEIDGAFKWGTGPYLDGLFTQGNLGVVTRITLVLARKPERVTAFFFRLKNEQDLEPAVDAVRTTLECAGANIGGINLMNAERVLSMVAPWPHQQAPEGHALPDSVIANLAQEHRTSPWNGVGAIYGTCGIAAATRREVRRQLKPYVNSLVFITPGRLKLAQGLVRVLPKKQAGRLRPLLDALASSIDVFAGRPSEVALQLPYWKNADCKPKHGQMDPARDGCGLIWYAPLVPMRSAQVRAFEKLVRAICREYGIEPLITLTSQSSRCFDATIPLLFRLDDDKQTARAQACYEALFRAGQNEGFLPYRMGVHSMDMAVTNDTPFWRMASRIKQAVDPENIIAPKRYSQL